MMNSNLQLDTSGVKRCNIKGLLKSGHTSKGPNFDDQNEIDTKL